MEKRFCHVIIIAIPYWKYGEAVLAIVESRENHILLEEIINYCKQVGELYKSIL